MVSKTLLNVLMSIIFVFGVVIRSCRGAIVEKDPTVFVAVLVRNKAHSLPYFLTCLHDLDYPKNRMHLWVYSDHNEDDSERILEEWERGGGRGYAGVNVTRGAAGRYGGDPPTVWGEDRFRHVIRLREDALTRARAHWADYLLMVDADVLLTSPRTLRSLISKNHVVVAPMLLSDGLYSNFWCGMTAEYYYERTEQYERILRREEVGCFPVKMVHSAVLVALSAVDSDLLTYRPDRIRDYRGPHDDIIAFAVNAHMHDIPLMVCNGEEFGYVPVPAEETADLERERGLFTDLLLAAAGRGLYLYPAPSLSAALPPAAADTLGLRRVYVINLPRRTHRRRHMEYCLRLLRVRPTFFTAVDGKTVDLDAVGVTLLPDYEDPYHHRPMKAGEVGCFLSHYYIWQQIAEQEDGVSLVLEDDIRFTSDFRNNFRLLMEELQHHQWDLTYVGRKVLSELERAVSPRVVVPGYSYWTLGYLLSPRGARILLAPAPLQALLPVDEYIPIMYDCHPNSSLSRWFPDRTLRALSAFPLLVHPTHYTGDPGYLSDTEDSPLALHSHGEL